MIGQVFPANPRVPRECIERNGITAAAALEMSMRKDELRWIIIIAEVLREFCAAHSDLDVLAYFKVKMRIVKPMRIAQGRDLLTASHRLAAMDEDFLQMRVERIDISRLRTTNAGCVRLFGTSFVLYSLSCECSCLPHLFNRRLARSRLRLSNHRFCGRRGICLLYHILRIRWFCHLGLFNQTFRLYVLLRTLGPFLPPNLYHLSL